MSQKNLFHLTDTATCWESKSWYNKEDGTPCMDIPAGIRLCCTPSKLAFQWSSSADTKLSEKQREIIIDEKKWRNPTARSFQVFTPFTWIPVGRVIVPSNEVFDFVTETDDASLANCLLLVNHLDAWQLYLYSKRHLHKGEKLYIHCPVADKVQSEPTGNAFLYLKPWLPYATCGHLYQKFYSLLVGSGTPICLNTTDQSKFTRKENAQVKESWIKPPQLKKHVNDWTEFVLFYCVRMLMNVDSDLDTKHIEDAVCEAYGFKSPTLLLVALAVEGFYNSKLNLDYYRVFTIRFMMNLSQTKATFK